jgi:hypothetical protein
MQDDTGSKCDLEALVAAVNSGSEIPAVDPVDLEKCCGVLERIGASTAATRAKRWPDVSLDVFEEVCGPGADYFAIWIRSVALGALLDTGALTLGQANLFEGMARMRLTGADLDPERLIRLFREHVHRL